MSNHNRTTRPGDGRVYSLSDSPSSLSATLSNILLKASRTLLSSVSFPATLNPRTTSGYIHPRCFLCIAPSSPLEASKDTLDPAAGMAVGSLLSSTRRLRRYRSSFRATMGWGMRPRSGWSAMYPFMDTAQRRIRYGDMVFARAIYGELAVLLAVPVPLAFGVAGRADARSKRVSIRA